MAKNRATTGLSMDVIATVMAKFAKSVVTRLLALVRETYGGDFAKGYRSDAKLSTVLKSTGAETLSEYLEHRKRGNMLVGTLRQEYTTALSKGRRRRRKDKHHSRECGQRDF